MTAPAWRRILRPRPKRPAAAASPGGGRALNDDPSPFAALLERAEHFIYLATALFLVAAAAALLVFAVIEVVAQVFAGDYDAALLQLLDRALLVLMVAEIIYTVGTIARRRRLEAEPFFIDAIIAAIRRILIITAESTHNANLADPHFQGSWSSSACSR